MGVVVIVDPNADPGPVPDDDDVAASIIDLLDIPPIDDTEDPFAALDPQWKRLARHLMDHFDPNDLPLMLRPFAPAATSLLAAQLAGNPESSRETTLELIDLTVRDLQIPLTDLQCWDASGAPLAPVDA